MVHIRLALILVLCCVATSLLAAERLLPGTADAISRGFLGPMKSDFMLPTELGLEFEEISIENASGEKLRLWSIPARNAVQTIVFCTGNQGNISSNLAYAKILVDGGFNVVMFDYQGFGGSTGVASALSLYSDTAGVVEYLINERKLSPKSIGIFGVSLGSALAVAAAAHYDLGAVAVEDILLPQRKLDEIAAQLPNDFASKLALGTIRNVILPQVDPIANAKRLHCPMFIMHGENDELLPPIGSVDLATAARSPVRLWLMDDAGHAPETLEIYEGEYAIQLQSFFKEAFDDRLAVPSVELSTSKEVDQWSATVSIESAKEGCYQIALASDKGECYFIRRIVPGKAVIECSVPFEPKHLSAIELHQVTKESDDVWTPLKSERSRSLAAYRHFVSELARNCPEQHRMAMFIGMLRENPFVSANVLHWIEANLPKAEDVHPEVRARYAKLLSSVFARLEPLEQDKHFDFLELINPFIPSEPDKYFELDNASFELQLRDERLAGCLILQAKLRYESGQLEAARELLAKAYSVSNQQWPVPSMVDALQLNADFYKSIGSPYHQEKTQAK
jgi:pimeloyl-ACP methyl ester carboxylesterase